MATTIEMPQMSYNMQEGTVVKWRKREGDTVSRGEVITEIETDKAVVEMEAYAGGVLKKVVVEEGKTVPVGSLIAVITAPDEELPSLEGLQSQAAPPQAPADEVREAVATTPPEAVPEASTSVEMKASPIARRLAKEGGIDLAKISGTGPGGRITEADVKASQEAPAPAAPAVAQRIRLSKMRQAIARRTSQSKGEAPHFYVTAEIDMGKALDMRQDMNDTLPEGVRISVNDLVIKACALAIGRFPNFNASYQENQLVISPHVNIGVAIALEQGLIVASVPDCEDRDW